MFRTNKPCPPTPKNAPRCEKCGEHFHIVEGHGRQLKETPGERGSWHCEVDGCPKTTPEAKARWAKVDAEIAAQEAA